MRETRGCGALGGLSLFVMAVAAVLIAVVVPIYIPYRGLESCGS